MLTDKELIDAAKLARGYAYAPISNFKVGAALLTSSGKVFTGCNIEDPSGIGITNICAERCAVVKAVSEGSRDFSKIAIVGGANDADAQAPCLPCGACRQYLNSFAPQITVLTLDGGALAEHTLTDLLPRTFNETFG